MLAPEEALESSPEDGNEPGPSLPKPVADFPRPTLFRNFVNNSAIRRTMPRAPNVTMVMVSILEFPQDLLVTPVVRDRDTTDMLLASLIPLSQSFIPQTSFLGAVFFQVVPQGTVGNRLRAARNRVADRNYEPRIA